MLLSVGVTAFSTFALLTFHALFRSPLAARSRNLAGLLELERVLDLASLTAPVTAVVLFAGIGFVWTSLEPAQPSAPHLRVRDERADPPRVDARRQATQPRSGRWTPAAPCTQQAATSCCR